MSLMSRTEFDALCATLETHFPVSCTSHRRTLERNLAVGGHPNSFHLLGLARDYVFDSGTFGAVKEQFKRRARQMGLDAIDEGDHWHVEPMT